MHKKQPQTSCDTCLYYSYDEDYEAYMCDMDMDEDEYAHLFPMTAIIVLITEMIMNMPSSENKCKHTLRFTCFNI